MTVYKELNQTFGFLRNLENTSTDEIRSASSLFLQKYPTDIEDTLAEELLHFVAFLRVEHSQLSLQDISSNRQRELQLFLTIVDNGHVPKCRNCPQTIILHDDNKLHRRTKFFDFEESEEHHEVNYGRRSTEYAVLDEH